MFAFIGITPSHKCTQIGRLVTYSSFSIFLAHIKGTVGFGIPTTGGPSVTAMFSLGFSRSLTSSRSVNNRSRDCGSTAFTFSNREPSRRLEEWGLTICMSHGTLRSWPQTSPESFRRHRVRGTAARLMPLVQLRQIYYQSHTRHVAASRLAMSGSRE